MNIWRNTIKKYQYFIRRMKILKRGDPRSAATAHLFLKCCPRSSHSHFLRVPSTASRWVRITTPLVRQNPYRVNLFGEYDTYIYRLSQRKTPNRCFSLYHWSQHETLNTWSQHETLNKKYFWYDLMTISKVYIEFHKITSFVCPWKVLGDPWEVLGDP